MLNSLTGIAFSQFCVPGNALTNALSDALAMRYLCLDKSYFTFFAGAGSRFVSPVHIAHLADKGNACAN
jgi:hypothetical protein